MENYKREHCLREKRMDKKFKEAMDSIEQGNKALDKIDINLDKLDRSVNSYCKNIKKFSIIIISEIILIAIIVYGFILFLGDI